MDEIEKFIDKRFKIDCDWLAGNCYWFAYILCGRFKYLTIFYNYELGHFMSVDVKNMLAYDFSGKHQLKNLSKLVELNKLKTQDESWYARLQEDCIN